MVTCRRFSEDREVAIVPVKTGCIGYYSANACTMSSYPFGCRLNNDIGTKVNRAEEIASRSEGVIDYQRNAIVMSQFCK